MSREVYADRVEVRPFIEGVFFPYAKSINVTDSPQRVRCQMEVPSSIHLREDEMVGATFHLFYANKRVLDQRGESRRTMPSDWPILFQGELSGINKQESVQSRRTTLEFISHTRHFEQTRLFHVHPERGGSPSSLAAAQESKVFMGNTEINLEYSKLTKVTRIWMNLFEVIEKLGNTDPGRNIAYGEAILRIMRTAISQHPVFATFNNRFKLGQRFGVYADPDLKTLIGLKKLQKLFNKRAKQMPTFAPLMQLINVVNNICKYDFNHISQPKLRQADDRAEREAANRQADLVQNINNYRRIAQSIGRVIQQKENQGQNINSFKIPILGDTPIDFSAQISSGDPNQSNRQIYKNLRDEKTDPVPVNPNAFAEKVADNLASGDPDQSLSSQTQVRRAVENALNKFWPKVGRPNEEVGGAPDVDLPASKSDSKDSIKIHQKFLKNRDELTEFTATPNMEFSMPPRCNAILPQNLRAFGIQRNYLQEPTRLMGKLPFSGGKDIIRWYVAPASQTFYEIEDGNVKKFGPSFEQYENRVLGRKEKEDTPEVQASANSYTFVNIEPKKPRGGGDDLAWVLPIIEKAKDIYGVSDAQFPNWHLLALISRESGGRTNVCDYEKQTRCGMLQMSKYKYIEDVKPAIIKQKSKKFYNQHFSIDPNDKFYKNYTGELAGPGEEVGAMKLRHIYTGDAEPETPASSFGGNPGGVDHHEGAAFRSLLAYFAIQIDNSHIHNWEKDIMAMLHHRPVTTINYVEKLEEEGKESADQWFRVSQEFAVKNARNKLKLYQWLVKNEYANGEGYPGSTMTNAQGRTTITPELLSGQVGESKYATENEESGNVKMTPFSINQMVTPEEVRKGIIANIFHIEDWWLQTLTDVEETEEQQKKMSRVKDQNSPAQNQSRRQNQSRASSSGGSSNTEGSSTRADLLSDDVHRYTMSVVEAEFYRRRFQKRTVPAATGGFNPYVASGFPGLIVDPIRPILGKVRQVTHSIDVQSASGQTRVNFSSPRYWDEGEVWYWVGGWNPQDLAQMDIDYEGNEASFRHFPHWHNRWTVPTNSFEPPKKIDRDDPVFASNRTAFDAEGGLGIDDPAYTNDALADWSWGNIKDKKRRTELDDFYQFFLGCDAIDYLSNHAHSKYVKPEHLKQAFVERDPVINDTFAYNVHPQTLTIQEYNTMIASVDEAGTFKRGTIAEQFWGSIEPQHANEANADMEEVISYIERYGVGERDLLGGFLDNEPKEFGGLLVWVGETFGGKKEISLLQKQVIDYIKSLEPREAGGGVPS